MRERYWLRLFRPMTVRVVCYEVATTDKALCLSRLPRSRITGSPKGTWIPKSMIEHITRYPPEPQENWRKIEITVEEWMAEKKGLL